MGIPGIVFAPCAAASDEGNRLEAGFFYPFLKYKNFVESVVKLNMKAGWQRLVLASGLV